MNSLYLGVDCGTQGTKALIVDADGNVAGRGYAPHDLIERPSGAREQEPSWWVAAMRTAIHQALTTCDPTRVLAMSVSGQQHGLVVLDDDLRVIRPAKLWNDTETAPDNDSLVIRLGDPEACARRYGIVPLTGYTVSKLQWMQRCEPANFARIRHILLPHDYLNWWLTGTACTEFGDASGTGYFDVRNRQWATGVLDLIDDGTHHLARALPALVSAGSFIGNLLADRAADLGLPALCSVACGGGDNMMGAIGTGNVREGVVTLSLGTSATLYSYREAPLKDPAPGVAAFCSSTGGWLPLVCTMNATNVVTQTLALFGKTVEDLDALLDASAPGSGGLTFVPYLNGERTPDLPRANGSLLGLTANNMSPANIVRSAVEGVTFGLLDGMGLIFADPLDNDPSTIVTIGGGARSAAWRQMIADITGATIQVPLEPEAGCLGAAIQAMHTQAVADGHALSFDELASRCIRMDMHAQMTPDTELREPYRLARKQYRAAAAEVAAKYRQ